VVAVSSCEVRWVTGEYVLNIVPVGGGASVLKVAGSTCGRAGRRLRRIIFLTFFPSAFVVMVVSSVVICASSVEVAVSREVSGAASADCVDGDCTSAIIHDEV
jgi:hypothetical protein